MYNLNLKNFNIINYIYHYTIFFWLHFLKKTKFFTVQYLINFIPTTLAWYFCSFSARWFKLDSCFENFFFEVFSVNLNIEWCAFFYFYFSHSKSRILYKIFLQIKTIYCYLEFYLLFIRIFVSDFLKNLCWIIFSKHFSGYFCYILRWEWFFQFITNLEWFW